MNVGIVIPAAGGAVAAVALLTADRVVEWSHKRFWGRLSTSSRAAVLVSLVCIMAGVTLPVPAMDADATIRGLVALSASVFVFLAGAQLLTTLRGRQRMDRYHGRHR